MRNARDPSSFLRFRNYSGDGGAPARDQQSIGDDRLDQRAGERIAGLVMSLDSGSFTRTVIQVPAGRVMVGGA